MILSTTHSIEEYQIQDYLGIVTEVKVASFRLNQKRSTRP